MIVGRPKTGRAREKMQAEVGPSAFFIARLIGHVLWPRSQKKGQKDNDP